MPHVDLSIEELRRYVPASEVPADLERFWAETLAESAATAVSIELEAAPSCLRGVRFHRARFAGFGGARIAGWYARPEGEGPFPALVWYHGYSGRGMRPLELYATAAQGIAVLSMDCRGQGGESDEAPDDGAGHRPGWLTKGVRDPAAYYYRFVYADAVRALEALAARPEVDPARIAVTGASQGGGLALAAAALSDRPCFVWADMPFLCHFRRGVEVALNGPYPELAELVRRQPDLEAHAFATLAYFDNLNLAPWISAPTVVTIGLWDDVCPPSTVFPTFARIMAADKELRTSSYLGHELSYELEEARLAALVGRLSRSG